MIGILEQEQLDAMKNEFLTLLRSTNRPGMDNLINWLETGTDFFKAPASQGYHGDYPGGLLEHSLNVYKAARKLLEVYKEIALPEKKFNEIPEDTLIICTLLHDLCKANFYKEEEKWFKDNKGQWHSYLGYVINDAFPAVHGSKSCFLIQYYVYLRPDELVAIQMHMFGFDSYMVNPQNTYVYKPLSQALDTIPMTILLSQADMAASFTMEKNVDQKVANFIK